MAIDPNMTFWINGLIFTKLAEICPSLNLNGEDRKVYDICRQDFKNYINYLDSNHLRMEEISVPSISPLDEMISVMIGETGLTQNLESTKEVAEFIDMWVHMWLKKWVQRTKILFNNKDLPSDFSKAPATFLPDIFSAEEFTELMRAVTDKLIQYGEICCTQIMADALFKKQIDAANAASKREWTTQDKLNFLTKLQREAKMMSYTHGPLIFIRPDNYYKVREWRDDGASRIV